MISTTGCTCSTALTSSASLQEAQERAQAAQADQADRAARAAQERAQERAPAALALLSLRSSATASQDITGTWNSASACHTAPAGSHAKAQLWPIQSPASAWTTTIGSSRSRTTVLMRTASLQVVPEQAPEPALARALELVVLKALTDGTSDSLSSSAHRSSTKATTGTWQCADAFHQQSALLRPVSRDTERIHSPASASLTTGTPRCSSHTDLMRPAMEA